MSRPLLEAVQSSGGDCRQQEKEASNAATHEITGGWRRHAHPAIPHDVFEALADPSITTRFWYTKSSGRMVEGAELTWEWEMHGVSGKVWVKDVETNQRIRFAWEGYDPSHPTTVEFLLVPYENNSTYLRITETGFSGDADTQVSRALESTAGFTFLLSSLEAALEHNVTLDVVQDAHPPNLQMASLGPCR